MFYGTPMAMVFTPSPILVFAAMSQMCIVMGRACLCTFDYEVVIWLNTVGMSVVSQFLILVAPTPPSLVLSRAKEGPLSCRRVLFHMASAHHAHAGPLIWGIAVAELFSNYYFSEGLHYRVLALSALREKHASPGWIIAGHHDIRWT